MVDGPELEPSDSRAWSCSPSSWEHAVLLEEEVSGSFHPSHPVARETSAFVCPCLGSWSLALGAVEGAACQNQHLLEEEGAGLQGTWLWDAAGGAGVCGAPS